MTAVIGCAALLTACGGSDDDGAAGDNGRAGGPGIILPPTGGARGVPIGGTSSYVVPPGFTKAELGAFKLGDPFEGDQPPPSAKSDLGSECANTILAVVRDFNGASDPNGHGDFEVFSGKGVTKTLVDERLGDDRKPKYTGNCGQGRMTAACLYGQQTTTEAAFNQWYRYAPNVNVPYVLYLSLEPNNGVLTFQSHMYFPLDGAGLGNQGRSHNYHFTTEIHTEIIYQGGETFRFIGDDDVWVFLNNRLALDLGGLHEKVEGTIVLDEVASELGLEKGKIYPLDLFHAERHTKDSNFRVDTNLRFTNCGEIVPETPVR